MNLSRQVEAGRSPEGCVQLNIQQLKSLRLGLGVSQEALAAACADRRLSLSLASIKRAESGKPVLYRTARRLAAFFGVPLQGMVQQGDASPAGIPVPVRHAHERLQCRAALEAAQATGAGRLIELHGPVGAGKSRLLAACTDEARQRGFRCIEMRMQGAGGRAVHPLLGLASGLLGMASPPVGTDGLEAIIRQRLDALGLRAVSAHACLDLFAGEGGAQQFVAIEALIRRAARDSAILLSIDDTHCGDAVLTALLDRVLPGSLTCPVTWMLAFETGSCAAFQDLDATIARTVFHLAAPH